MKTKALQEISKICALGYFLCFGLFLYVYDIKNSENVINHHNEPILPSNNTILPMHIAKIGNDAEEL